MHINFAKGIHWIKSLTLSILVGIILFGTTINSAAQTPVDGPTPSASEYVATNFIYIPLVNNAASATSPTYDLTIGGLEVTQAIQDLNNSVPLIAGRKTVARLYAHTDEQAGTSPVSVSLSAYRDGALLPGSPLLITNGDAQSWSSDNELQQLRADISNSHNFLLPQDWISGQVTLEFKIDPLNENPETNENNNTQTYIVDFRNASALNLVVVPIDYYHAPTAKNFPAPTDFNFIESALMSLYPINQVNLSIHPSYQFIGDLRTIPAWENLLNDMVNLRSSEVGFYSQTIYYAVIPFENSLGNTWWSGGVMGIGVVGQPRASVGLMNAPNYGIDGGLIVVHEIGHNLGRDHAPCGVSPADRNYPYPGGIIGQFGLNVDLMSVIPRTFPDMMGYCEPAWISDYTYRAISRKFATTLLTVGLPEQESLYIRIVFNESGVPEIQPVYSFISTPGIDDKDGTYTIEFVDDLGTTIRSIPVSPSRFADTGLENQAIFAMLPKPDDSFSTIRLLHHGKLIAEKPFQVLDNPAHTQLTMQSNSDGLILSWGGVGLPAMVRYTQDNGKSWTTIAMDVTTGNVHLDPNNLPNGPILFQVSLADSNAKFELLWQKFEME